MTNTQFKVMASNLCWALKSGHQDCMSIVTDLGPINKPKQLFDFAFAFIIVGTPIQSFI